MTEIFIYIVLIFALNYIFKRINFIPNYTGEKHQLFTSQKVTQLTGGIYVFLIIVYIFSFNLEFLIFSFLILLIGLLSDKNYLKSPKKRIFIQFLLVLSFVFFLDLSISSTRIELINPVKELLLASTNLLLLSETWKNIYLKNSKIWKFF